jgi:hypothetical protein
MPVGTAQAAFGATAELDGIQLEPAKVSWINQRGHFGLPHQTAATTIEALEAIFVALGGQPDVQMSKRTITLPGDFYHGQSRTFVETDEIQHFTSFRLRTLELYPAGVPLGYDAGSYMDLCRQWAPQADRYRASKDAAGFGPGGRQRQRAYYDALRDLAIPAMGHPPVIRVPILNGNGVAAYHAHREQILAALGGCSQ